MSEGRVTVLSKTETPTEQDDIESGEPTPDEIGSAAHADSDIDGPEPDSTSESASDARTGHRRKAKRRRTFRWNVALAYAVLPALAIFFATAAGYFAWHTNEARESGTARIEALAAAKDTAVALLSYKPDTAEKDLNAARDRLTGTFKDSYTQLTRDVVIPGAKQKQITATATVPAVASVSATPTHVVALLYINQTTVIGGDAPSDSVSTVRVTVDKVDGRWLISEFDPI